MFYRQGQNPNCSKNFYFNGTKQDAYKRASDHCKIMHYTLVIIRPMVADLRAEEEVAVPSIRQIAEEAAQ